MMNVGKQMNAALGLHYPETIQRFFAYDKRMYEIILHLLQLCIVGVHIFYFRLAVIAANLYHASVRRLETNA